MPRPRLLKNAAKAAPPPLQELRPQRLSFVGGTLAGWGLALAGLHATLKTLQAPGIRVLRAFEQGGEAGLLDYSSGHFYVLSLLVAIGAAMVVVSAAYLCAHGMALRGGMPAPPGARPLVDVLFDGFVWLFRFAIGSALFSFPVIYLAIALDRQLVLEAGLATGTAAHLTRWTLIAAVLGGLWLWAARQARREGLDAAIDRLVRAAIGDAQRMHRMYVLGAVTLLVSACSLAVVDTAYVAELGVAKAVYEKNKDTWVEATVSLSGMTSDPADASLLLNMAGRRAQRVPLNVQAVEGRYVAVLPLRALPVGVYELVLVYERKTWSDLSWLDQRIERRVGFLVVE